MSAVSAYYRNVTMETGLRQLEPSVEMHEKHHTLSFLGRRPWAPRPLSEATEIFDTDDEDGADFEDPTVTGSTPRSMESMDDGSQSTNSSNGPPSPPPTAGLGGFEFHFDEKPIQGPNGPHMFHTASDLVRNMDDLEEPEFIPEMSPIKDNAFELSRHNLLQTPSSPITRTISTLPQAVSELDEAQVRSWTPRQVATWMREAGFDESLVAKFIQHDISGDVLLDLQQGDLKELDITSIGNRHRVMSSIQHLRNSSIEVPSRPASRERKSRALQRAAQPEEAKIMVYQTEDGRKTTSRSRASSRRRQTHRALDDAISPAESVSIVAIEQLLPKPHKCSKGEDCAKWRKQQKKILRYQEEFHRYENEIAALEAATSPNDQLYRPKSEAEPSVVGSSVALGPHADFSLTPQKLREIQQRDASESIRQFLNFQHMHSSASDPSPPPAASAAYRPTSPPRKASPPPLAEHLRTLPKLTIPLENVEQNNQAARTPISGLRGPNNFIGLQSHLLAQLQQDPYHYGGVASPADIYRHGTPASATDIPVTSFPMDPLSRDVSQSVPPDMRFGNATATTTSTITNSIIRPSSTQPSQNMSPLPPRNPSVRRARQPSFVPAIAPVSEQTPTTPATTIHATPMTVAPPTATMARPSEPMLPQRLEDVSHTGWMRKRKTTPLLRRHEWSDSYFRLAGTSLTSHSTPTSKPLDKIDVDEYAIACQSVASSSKLSAAFKKSILGNGYSTTMEQGGAFAFSLIPESKKFIGGDKSHHFAVQSRDERIEWMRDLMLAKALKRAHGPGSEVKVTGNVI